MFGLDRLLKLIDPPPVTVDHQACLPARHRQSPCRACADACPDQALRLADGKVQVDPDRCSRCGLCAGACPTAAVTLRGVDGQAVLASPQLRCSKAGGAGTALPCLGWLTADHLLTMALHHQREITLTTADCATCPWSRGGEMAAAAVTTANETLRALGRPPAVRLRTDAVTGHSGEERVLSRRELLALWRAEGAEAARQLLPEQDVNPLKLPARVPPHRTRWVGRVEPDAVPEGAELPEGPWKARTVSDACNGCGLCAAFCPTGAFAQAEEGPDWRLTHQPASCVACGTCAALCPVKAVGEEPLPAGLMVAGTRREVARLTALTCTSCKQEFRGRPGQTRCPQCQTMLDMLGLR